MSGTLVPLLELWDFNDPAASETRFRQAESDGKAQGDEGYAWEARTQAARCLGLLRRFDEADRDLDDVEAANPQLRGRVAIRYCLERGRVRNSSGDKAAAIPLFEEALRLAKDEGEEFLAVDAAHMLGIAEELAKALEWNQLALDMARAAKDPKAQNWKGSLLNNLAWTHHDKGEFERALAFFEEALAFRLEQGNPGPIRIARWCMARCKRSLGRIDEALMEQRALADEVAEGGEPDGYVQEEMGECLLAQGRPDESRPYFAKAYELLSQDPWLAANETERLERLKSLS